MPAQKQDLSTRFWAKVQKSDGCWIWTAGRFTAGYGAIQINDKQCHAHRVAYELTYGPIPPGLCVCHHCDNPPCVRPDHLWLGTHNDNAQDRNRKGRTRPAKTHPKGYKMPEGNNVGERNPRSKLTQKQVDEIRKKFKPRVVTAAMLAAEYGVSKHSIWHITGGETWSK